MNAQQAENLRVLIRHMETRCRRTLDMGTIFFQCGTPACALGEAWTVDGLKECFIERPRLSNYEVTCREIFGVHHHTRLFGGSIFNAWKNSYVTPQQWAAEARVVLTEHGYSMDVKPDAFPAFMAKVMEPVAVTA